MFKIRNLFIFCAALTFTALAFGLNKTDNITKENKAEVVAEKTIIKKCAKKRVTKKKHGKIAMLAKINLDAINAATLVDLEKALESKIAKAIVDMRTELGGKFADIKEFAKKIKLNKKEIKKLLHAFPKAEFKKTDNLKEAVIDKEKRALIKPKKQ